MKRPKLVVSLPNENSYQLEQARMAKEAAARRGAEVTVLFANNDSVTQSQQVLDAIQGVAGEHPDAILLEPLTATALSRAAQAAGDKGIGWVVMNCDVEYIPALRSRGSAPVFTVTRDHTQIGRMQGKQFAALLPRGGNILYIQGPATSLASIQRTVGMESTKAASIKIKPLRSPWTEQGAYEAVSAWLQLSTSKVGSVDLIGCQYDGIAMGARRAFEEIADRAEREQWLSRAFTGIDGLPEEGQAWVDQGKLTATIICGTTTGLAVELVMNALISGSQPPERTLIELQSYPTLERLMVVGSLRSNQ